MNHRLSNAAGLLALIAQGEGETVEFKRSVAELEQVVETVAGLANTSGGLVLIGVGPKGEVIGVDLRDQQRHVIGHPEGRRVAHHEDARTYAELNERVNQLVRAVRAEGLQPGDGVATLVFSCYGEERFLSEIRAGWDGTFYRVAKSKSRERLAKAAGSPGSVLVIAAHGR